MLEHVTREQLTAKAEQCLSDKERFFVEGHLKQCEQCRELERDAEEVVSRLSANAAELAGFSCADGVMSRIAETKRSGALAIRRSWLFDLFVGGRYSMAARVAAVSTVLVIVGVSMAIFLSTPSQAWSLEQSIEAVQGKRGVYFRGALAFGGTRLRCEMWVRGRQGSSRTDAVLLRAENGATMWVKGNATYFYTPSDSTPYDSTPSDSRPVVYTDDAQTAGISHWPGSEFLDLVRRVSRNVDVDTRLDLFGARRVIVLKAQIVDASGMKSFILEFDPSSKLLIGVRSWSNLDWTGVPDFEADSITYLDSAPDSLFAVDLPSDVVYRQREVAVPPEMLGLLSAPASGRSFPRLSPEEASRRIVEEVMTAEIQEDLAGFRRLAPIASLMEDEQLRAILGGASGGEAIVELLEVGEARLRGRSPLGPLFVVPFLGRQKDGKVIKQKIIVQVRPAAGGDFSCVVYGPHGQPYEMPEEPQE